MTSSPWGCSIDGSEAKVASPCKLIHGGGVQPTATDSVNTGSDVLTNLWLGKKGLSLSNSQTGENLKAGAEFKGGRGP